MEMKKPAKKATTSSTEIQAAAGIWDIVTILSTCHYSSSTLLCSPGALLSIGFLDSRSLPLFPPSGASYSSSCAALTSRACYMNGCVCVCVCAYRLKLTLSGGWTCDFSLHTEVFSDRHVQHEHIDVRA